MRLPAICLLLLLPACASQQEALVDAPIEPIVGTLTVGTEQIRDAGHFLNVRVEMSDGRRVGHITYEAAISTDVRHSGGETAVRFVMTASDFRSYRMPDEVIDLLEASTADEIGDIHEITFRSDTAPGAGKWADYALSNYMGGRAFRQDQGTRYDFADLMPLGGVPRETAYFPARAVGVSNVNGRMALVMKIEGTAPLKGSIVSVRSTRWFDIATGFVLAVETDISGLYEDGVSTSYSSTATTQLN